MKDFGIKLICTLEASLALYFLAGVGVIELLLERPKLADIEFMVPGAVLLLLTIFSWIALLNRYAFCRRRAAFGAFLSGGLVLTALASIAYPLGRTVALWHESGELGGAVLLIIIFCSLSAQLSGFVVGFIPSALFIRKLSGFLSRNEGLGKD